MTCSNQYPELHQNTEPHYLHLHWCLLRLWFQPRIKNPSHWDQYEKWRVWKPVLLYQAVYDLGSNDMLMGFSPHTVCSGRFMRFAVVLYRICVSVLWERWNELMLEICKLLWVFFFSFQTLLLTFFFRGSFVLNDFAFPDKYSTLPRLFFFFSSNNQMNVLLFLPWLPNDLHLWMSNDCTGGRGLLEKIIFKHMGIIIRKRNCYAWNEQRQL